MKKKSRKWRWTHKEKTPTYTATESVYDIASDTVTDIALQTATENAETVHKELKWNLSLFLLRLLCIYDSEEKFLKMKFTIQNCTVVIPITKINL